MKSRVMVFILLGCVLLVACEQRTHTVRYEVGGSGARISVSYINGTGATEQRDLQGSWRQQYQAQTWAYMGVSVFNANSSGTIFCRMYVDNVLIQEAESVGGYKWASCNGLAGITGATPTPKQ
jgi:hypothetical protein